MSSIVFCGSPAFACTALQALHGMDDFDVLLVITQPDKPAGRGKKLAPPKVKELAERLRLPVYQPKDINGAFLSKEWPLKGNVPDFLVTVAYGQILTQELLDWPKIAPLNVHASLLPHLRGASPIQHAILSGDRETGASIQLMTEKVDRGAILTQEKIVVDKRETFLSLSEKLSLLGARLLIETLRNIQRDGKYPGLIQKEDKATYCRKLTREMGRIDFHVMTAEEIDRKVRALVPWPGVQAVFQGKAMKIIESSLVENEDALKVSCANNTILYILKLQSPGKKVMTGKEWIRGMK